MEYSKERNQAKKVLEGVRKLAQMVKQRLDQLPEAERTGHGLNDTDVCLGNAECNMEDACALLEKLANGWTGFNQE